MINSYNKIQESDKNIYVCAAYDLNKFENVVRSGHVNTYKLDNYFLFVPNGLEATNTALQKTANPKQQSFNYESPVSAITKQA